MSYMNEAGWERVLRVVLGAALLFLGWGEVLTGGLGTFLKVIGFVPLATGVLGWCPIYALLHFRTNAPSDVSTIA